MRRGAYHGTAEIGDGGFAGIGVRRTTSIGGLGAARIGRRAQRVGTRRLIPVVIAVMGAAGCGSVSQIGVAPEYAAAVAELEALINREMAAKELPALSIALVDDQRLVWSKGFGVARPSEGVPATAQTVYRVGSVSKLFTDIAVMQLVEEGELDLDTPVTEYLPTFQPGNPYDKPITLRQLMSHRSGLVREPPVGSYFDPTAPSLAATVLSLNETELVYEPGSRSKYSNAAIATVGHVLEVVKGEPFADYLERAVLRPAGLERSSFQPRDDLMNDLAQAFMWGYDHRETAAPGFQLGMAPAGSMYSTVTDLGRFMSLLFAGGTGPRGKILSAEALETMWTPQWQSAPAPNAPRPTGFGLGFFISQLDGHRRIGHNGAIYGFATELAMLPDERLGVVVATTMDGANVVAQRIADEALRFMLASRSGLPPPPTDSTLPLPRERMAELEGRYRGTNTAVAHTDVELVRQGDRLMMMPLRGGFAAEIRAIGNDPGDHLGGQLITDDRLSYGVRIAPWADGIIIGRDTLRRVEESKPAAAPARWQGLIGEYGWDHNVLYILEKDARLYALIEWFFLYPLEEVTQNLFRFPNWGLYDGETLSFKRDPAGKATAVIAAGVEFPRRNVGTEAGVTFKIEPVRPVTELRAEAQNASPPRESGEFREPDLVELITLDPTIRLDIRYASTNNFMNAVFYAEPRAFLQRPAAEALLRAHQKLKTQGYGLLIHDAYRPWYVTRMFWDATPEEQKIFVADPSQGSRHNRGAAVDLTLYDLRTGRPIEMVGGYDEFSDRSFPDYPGGTALQRWHRRLLREAMEEQGFTVYDWEWWHFDYQEWARYPIQNIPFDRIGDGVVVSNSASAR